MDNINDLPLALLFDTAQDFVRGQSSSQGAVKFPLAFLNPNASLSPLAFGADPSGVQDSTAAFDRMFAAVPPTGAKISLPPGIFKTAGGHVCAYPIWLDGCGRGTIESLYVAQGLQNNAQTWIRCTSGSVPWLTISGNGSAFTNFRLSCVYADPTLAGQTAPISGNAGLYINSTGPACRPWCQNLFIDGFYRNMDFHNGQGAWISYCMFAHPWFADFDYSNDASLDNGNLLITGCQFLAGTQYQPNTDHGFGWYGGGGLVFSQNRFNTGPLLTNPANFNIFPNCIYWKAFGSTEATFTDNSFGAFAGSAVVNEVLNTSNNSFSKVLFHNNLGLQLADPNRASSPASNGAGNYLFRMIGFDSNTVMSSVSFTGNIAQGCGIAHLEYVRTVYIGSGNIAQGSGARGTPLIDIGSVVANVKRSPILTTESIGDTIGSYNMQTGWNQTRQVCVVEQQSQYNPSSDEEYFRLQSPAQLGLYAGTISGSSHVGSIVVWTVTGHKFSVGDMVYIAGVTGGAGNIAAQFNNLYHQVLAITTNTITTNAPTQTAITDDWTANGYIASTGRLAEIIARVGCAYTIEIDAEISAQTAVVPMMLSAKRNVWIQQAAAGQSTMAVVGVVGTDFATIDPTCNLSAGASPLLANTQALAGAVGTAAAQANDLIASVTAAGVGNGVELVFESVKQGTFPGTYSCSNAPASGTCAWSVSGTVLTCTVTGFTHNLNVGCAITISGLTAATIAAGSYTGTFLVTSVTNNNTFTVTVLTGGTIASGAGTAVYTRDRYLVNYAASYNVNAIQKNISVGHTIAAISGVALPASGTISTMTNPSPNIGQIVTSQPHTLTSTGGPLVTVTGSAIGAYNVTGAAITVIDATTFQFPIVGTGLGDGAAGATATLGCGTRRVAHVPCDNAFLVDTPYPFSFFQKALTYGDMSGNFNKLRVYVRPVNNTGLLAGGVRIKSTGRYNRFLRIGT